MRKGFFEICFVVLVLVMACCSKQNSTVEDNNAVQLLGAWELRQVQAGMTPTTQYPVGNGNRYHFFETTYQHYTNGALQKSGTYRVVRDTTVQAEVGLVLPAGQFTGRLIFDNELSAKKTFFGFEEGKLVLLSGYFPTDGGSRWVYEKTTTGK
jgi:hypothetical protein